MIGINAASIPAKMIKVQALIYRGHIHLIQRAMRWPIDPIYLYPAVSTPIQGSGPFPARTSKATIHQIKTSEVSNSTPIMAANKAQRLSFD